MKNLNKTLLILASLTLPNLGYAANNLRDSVSSISAGTSSNLLNGFSMDLTSVSGSWAKAADKAFSITKHSSLQSFDIKDSSRNPINGSSFTTTAINKALGGTYHTKLEAGSNAYTATFTAPVNGNTKPTITTADAKSTLTMSTKTLGGAWTSAGITFSAKPLVAEISMPIALRNKAIDFILDSSVAPSDANGFYEMIKQSGGANVAAPTDAQKFKLKFKFSCYYYTGNTGGDLKNCAKSAASPTAPRTYDAVHTSNSNLGINWRGGNADDTQVAYKTVFANFYISSMEHHDVKNIERGDYKVNLKVQLKMS